MKIDPCCQLQNCSAGILVSNKIRFIRIFVGVEVKDRQLWPLLWLHGLRGLRTWIFADPDPQIYLWTRMVCGSAKQTHLRTRTIRGSKVTSIVCRTNLERKCQCTSSQQFENWSIFGHCSRLCKSLFDYVGPYALSIGYSVIWPYLRMRTVRGHESTLQLRTRTIRGPDVADADYLRTWKLWIRTPLLLTPCMISNGRVCVTLISAERAQMWGDGGCMHASHYDFGIIITLFHSNYGITIVIVILCFYCTLLNTQNRIYERHH